jgi:hypothetical protein
MSAISPVPNGPSIPLSSALPYVIPPVSASLAIVPVFYGFIVKSAQQLQQPIPKMTAKEVFKRGWKAAPTIGGMVGTQMIGQEIFERLFNQGHQPKFASMLASSALVGMLSVPACAVFNGQTMGRTVKESMKSLSKRQAMAIIAREASFVFSVRISGPVSEQMKNSLGDHKAVQYSSIFVSGAIGGLIGHPADTALTLSQEGVEVTHFRQLLRGASVRALTVGGFSFFYKLTQEAMVYNWKK